MAQRPSTSLRVVEAQPRICGNCVHGALGAFGAHCTLYHEDIWDEAKTAAACEEFSTW
jgi:hypothetical protein